MITMDEEGINFGYSWIAKLLLQTANKKGEKIILKSVKKGK